MDCATPRSGSTLLKPTGVAGRPEEYFESVVATERPPRPESYLEGLDDPEALALVGGASAPEPQRAIRTERFKYIRRFGDHQGPVLPNCDDGPTKNELIAAGWPDWEAEPEQLYDLVLDPNEMRNLIADPRLEDVAGDLRSRLQRWMTDTDDPLLDGPVPLPPGAWANAPDQISAGDRVSAGSGGEDRDVERPGGLRHGTAAR
jgi:arylsulfatase A-like enzyme